MNTQRVMVAGAAALAASITAVCAGPCSDAIDSMQARVDARFEAVAGSGQFATQSTQAQLHRQPTPGSIAAAEARLGELSASTMEAIKAGMARAREADRVGDQRACEQALAEVQRAIGP